MVSLAQIKILPSRLRQPRRELRPDESAKQREHAAENPHAENQKRRGHMQRHHVWIDENARADDPAHDDHRGVERVQASRWVWRGQGREDSRRRARSSLKVSRKSWSLKSGRRKLGGQAQTT